MYVFKHILSFPSTWPASLKGKRQRSALFVCFFAKWVQLLDVLCSVCNSSWGSNRRTPLQLACVRGHPSFIAACNCKPTCTTCLPFCFHPGAMYYTCLHLASHSWYPQVVKAYVTTKKFKVRALKLAVNEASQWSLMNEYRMSQVLGKQDNILRIKAVESDRRGYAKSIAMMVCEASLLDIIDEKRQQAKQACQDPTGQPPFTVQELLPLAEGILRGLQHCKQKRVGHLDLKALNLLLATKGDLSSVKLADFGIAQDYGTVVRCAMGTYMYMAPELLAFKDNASATPVRIGPEQDVFSVCMLFAELLSGLTAEEVRKYSRYGPLKTYLCCDDDLATAIWAGLEEDPRQRIRLEDLVAALHAAGHRLRHTGATAATFPLAKAVPTTCTASGVPSTGSASTAPSSGGVASTAATGETATVASAARGTSLPSSPAGGRDSPAAAVSPSMTYREASSSAASGPCLHLISRHSATAEPAGPASVDAGPGLRLPYPGYAKAATASATTAAAGSVGCSTAGANFTSSEMARLALLLPPIDSPTATSVCLASAVAGSVTGTPSAACSTAGSKFTSSAMARLPLLPPPVDCSAVDKPLNAAPVTCGKPDSPSADTRRPQQMAASPRDCNPWWCVPQHRADATQTDDGKHKAWQEQQAAAAAAAQGVSPVLPLLRISRDAPAAPVMTPDTVATPMVDDAFNVGSALARSPTRIAGASEQTPGTRPWRLPDTPGTPARAPTPTRVIPTARVFKGQRDDRALGKRTRTRAGLDRCESSWWRR